MSTTRESHTVLVQPSAPTAIEVEEEMPREQWAAYHQAIWDARLSAHLHARYFASLRRAMGALSVLLQSTVLLGSAGAFVALLASLDPRLPVYFTGAVTAVGIILQATGLPGRVQKAATLEEAWAVRRAFWDDAWILVSGSQYLGSISELRAPEAALAKVEAELGIPTIDWHLRRVMRVVERTDTFAKARFA